MNTVRILLGLFLAAAVCVGTSDVFAAAPPGAGKKGQHRSISGTVVEVDHVKAGGEGGPRGLLKVRVHGHGRGKNAGGKGKEGEVVAVRVDSKTRFELVSFGGKGKDKGKGAKGVVKEKLAHFRDVQPGMHVRVKLDHGHHAEEVDILPEGKGKGKGKDKGKGKGKK